MMVPQPKYYFAKKEDLTNWPVPPGFYMVCNYSVPAGTSNVIATLYTNANVSNKELRFYQANGQPAALPISLDDYKQFLSDTIADAPVGFFPLSKDPLGTPSMTQTPTPAWVAENPPSTTGGGDTTTTEEKKGMSPLLLGLLFVGAIYLLKRSGK